MPRLPRTVAGARIPPGDDITIHFDGEPVAARAGEPVAAALVAAGKLTIARSPKFHRPRGPACFRAACDGCLARVDDTPNVMTCMTPARDGMTVVSQNRLGPREADLLRMTDWFFPEGMNHHELFAGVPGLQTVMQAFARRVAGLGKLPVARVAPRRAERRAADVVVVGAGPSGMAVASRLADAGRAVEIVDDQIAPGGAMAALGQAEAEAFHEIRASFMDRVERGRVVLRARTVAGGVYGADLLVANDDGASILEPRALVLACGAHDGAVAFEGNDLPGVMSARAAGLLLSYGVVPGERIVVVVPDGGGPFGESYAAELRRLGARARAEVVHGEPVRAAGTSHVKKVFVRTPKGTRELPADAALVDGPRAPAYELALQAGASVEHAPRGFVVRADGGRAAPGVFAAGEMAGVPFDAAAIAEDAERVAAAVLATA